MHIYELWQGDLYKFLDELDKYEEQEERDRLAHTAQANGGKPKGGKRGAGGAKRAPGAKKNGPPAAPAKKGTANEEGGKMKNGAGKMPQKQAPAKKGRKGSDDDDDYEDDS
jgi:hypothetical protein